MTYAVVWHCESEITNFRFTDKKHERYHGMVKCIGVLSLLQCRKRCTNYADIKMSIVSKLSNEHNASIIGRFREEMASFY